MRKRSEIASQIHCSIYIHIDALAQHAVLALGGNITALDDAELATNAAENFRRGPSVAELSLAPAEAVRRARCLRRAT